MEAPHRSAIELASSDTLCDAATNHGNSSDNPTINSSLPLPELVSLVFRPSVSETEPLRRSSRQIKLPAKLNDFNVTINCGKVKYPFSCWSFMLNVNKHVEPKSVVETLQNPA